MPLACRRGRFTRLRNQSSCHAVTLPPQPLAVVLRRCAGCTVLLQRLPLKGKEGGARAYASSRVPAHPTRVVVDKLVAALSFITVSCRCPAAAQCRRKVPHHQMWIVLGFFCRGQSVANDFILIPHSRCLTSDHMMAANQATAKEAAIGTGVFGIYRTKTHASTRGYCRPVQKRGQQGSARTPRVGGGCAAERVHDRRCANKVWMLGVCTAGCSDMRGAQFFEPNKAAASMR